MWGTLSDSVVSRAHSPYRRLGRRLVARLTVVAVIAGGTALVGLGTTASPVAAAPTNCLTLAEVIPVPTAFSPDPSEDPGDADTGQTALALDDSTNVLFAGAVVEQSDAGGLPNVSGSLVAVDRATGATLGTLAMPDFPNLLAVNAATDRVYATNTDTSNPTLTVIDGATDSLVTVVQMPSMPHSIAVDEANDLVYVASETGGDVTTISVIDGASSTIVDSITNSDSIESLALDQQTGILYAADGSTGKILAFDASSLTLVRQGVITGQSSPPVIQGLTVDPSTNRVYASILGIGPSDTLVASIVVFDGATDSEIASIPVAGRPVGSDNLSLDATRQLLYASVQGPDRPSEIAVIDLTTDTVAEMAATPSSPAFLAANPVTGELFTEGLPVSSIDAFQERPCGAADTDPPLVNIDAPADGATYPIYSRVVASYGCSDAGSGLSTAIDPDADGVADGCVGLGDFPDGGENSTGQLVNTTTPGVHTFTVTATDNAGLTTTVTRTYTVVGDLDTTPPDIVVTSPTEGENFPNEAVAPAQYSCVDTGGSGLASCSEQGAVDGLLDTEGHFGEDKVFSVFATDRAGNSTSVVVDYTVTALPPRIFLNLVDNAVNPVFSLGQVQPVTYACNVQSTGGPQPATCVGSGPSGSQLDTSTAGTFDFTVNATDSWGNTSSKSFSYTVLAGNASQTVSGGDVVTTDPGGLGPSPTVPVQTQIAVPQGVAGTITVTPRPVGASPPGFVLFGSEVDLTGPEAPSAATPYVMTFTVDASALGATLPSAVQVFRNGVVVPDCTDPSAAIPDPCVQTRGPTPDGTGDAFITVRTTGFSAWTLGSRVLGLGITGVAPNARVRGATHQTVVVTGSGFVTGSSVTFSGSGVTVASTHFVDANHLSADVSVSNTAALGARDVRVTNPGSPATTTTCSGCFTVDAKPTITSLSPNARPQGSTNQTVTINGTGFETGATVAISGTGVVVNSVIGSGAALSLNVSVAAGAPTGARDVTVTNPDGGVVIKNNAFTVSAKPAVMSVAPSAVAQGATATLQVLGSNFASGSTLTFGPGITINSVTRNSANKLTAHVVVFGGAALGTSDVTVTNPDGGTATCTGCLTVNPAPTVGTVTPSARPRGATHQLVAVTGTGYEAGVSAAISGGGVTVDSLTRHGATSVTLDVSISASAALGSRNLTINNPDGGTAVCTGCFTVDAKPTITAVTPTSKPHGGTYAIVITGTGFQVGAIASLSGTGIQVSSTTGNTTTLTVTITVSSTAPKTTRDVTVTNPDTGSVTKSNAFKIT